MFKYLLEMALIVIGGLLLVSQVIIPAIGLGVDIEMFWMFKKSKPKTPQAPTGDIAALADELKQASIQHKTSVKKVDDAIHVLEKAKEVE